MSRKDTIIVALLINAGLLALLFMLAINTDDHDLMPSVATSQVEKSHVAGSFESPSAKPTTIVSIAEEVKVLQPEVDEVKTFLKELNTENIEKAAVAENLKLAKVSPANETLATSKNEPTPLKMTQDQIKKAENEQDFVEVTVKRGDALEKIARNNGTTTEAIISANGLQSTKLSVGQTLRIPIAKSNVAKSSVAKAAVKGESATLKTTDQMAKELNLKPLPLDKKESAVARKEAPGSVYYTIKQGDSPWKIAKDNNLKLDDFLQLNGLNDKTAKNLIPGDKVRVK